MANVEWASEQLTEHGLSRLSRRRLRYKRLERFHFDHNEIIRVVPRFIRPFSFKGRMGLFILKWKEGFT